MSEAAGAKESVQLRSSYSRSVVLTSLLPATVLRLLTLGHTGVDHSYQSVPVSEIDTLFQVFRL